MLADGDLSVHQEDDDYLDSGGGAVPGKAELCPGIEY